MAAFSVSAGRKTLEIPIDRALLDATMSPASVPGGPPSIKGPTPEPPPTPLPSAPSELTLELDSPWDEGWDSSPPPGLPVAPREAEKK